MMNRHGKSRAHAGAMHADGGAAFPGCACTGSKACAAAAGRRGMIFVVTMWIVLVLTGLVLVLGQAMQTEGTISANEFPGGAED